MRIPITTGGEDREFTGEWFDSEAIAQKWNPRSHRGAPYILMRTRAGNYVLLYGGMPNDRKTVTAEKISQQRALAIRVEWGDTLDAGEQVIYDALEV